VLKSISLYKYNIEFENLNQLTEDKADMSISKYYVSFLPFLKNLCGCDLRLTLPVNDGRKDFEN